MTLRCCGHGHLLGTGCVRCDQMRRAIEGEERTEAPPAPTLEERELRRASRWPDFLEDGLREGRR